MTKAGAEFEKAVYAFARTLDPQAEVIFDHHVPDRDTGTPRQCDVWINAKFGGHWPLSILVSCKDHGRPLDIGDIGTFCSEIHSTGASTGVIYSKTGFYQPALDKAKANGVSCCRLYVNEPADIPVSIIFDQFACKPQHWLVLDSNLVGTSLKTWDDVFNLPEGNTTVLDVIATESRDAEQRSIEESSKRNSFPPGWTLQLRFAGEQIRPEIKIRIVCHWKCYRARLEANLLNGSYCLSDKSYKGEIIGPAIDTLGEHPGDAWMEITDNSFTLPTNRVLMILCKGDIKDDLRTLGTNPLPGARKEDG